MNEVDKNIHFAEISNKDSCYLVAETIDKVQNTWFFLMIHWHFSKKIHTNTCKISEIDDFRCTL